MKTRTQAVSVNRRCLIDALKPFCHEHFKKGFLLSIVTFISVTTLGACSTQQVVEPPSVVKAEYGDSISSPRQPSTEIGQEQILKAQAEQARKVEVIFSARVRKLLRDDTKGLPHQQFLLELENGSTVKVAHDTQYAPRVPIQAGDLVTIKGEYIWNKRGGVVHWTHRSDNPRHEGGYIEFAGNRYE